MSVCRPLSWTWPGIASYLRSKDPDGHFAKKALFAENIVFLDNFIRLKEGTCKAMLQDFTHVSKQLVEMFEEERQEGPLYFSYIQSQLKFCIDFMTFEPALKPYQILYFAKKFNPLLDLSNKTLVSQICGPLCTEEVNSIVAEWFDKNLDLKKFLSDGNCSSTDGAVQKWCSECWEKENKM